MAARSPPAHWRESRRHATAPRARHAGCWLPLLAGGSDIQAGARPAPPGHHHHDAEMHGSSATMLHYHNCPRCPLRHNRPQRKRAAPTVPPCETQPRRRKPALSRRHPKPPPLLALWLPYGPQEPTKRPKAPCPMSADSGRRSGAVLKPGGCGAGQAMFSGCE